jgi:hypothetical protein
MLARETQGESNISVEGFSDAMCKVEITGVIDISETGTIEIEGVAGATAAVAVFAALGAAGSKIIAGSDTGSGGFGAKESSTWVCALKTE